MKHFTLVLALFISLACNLNAQIIEWNMGIFGFADNREYKSSVQIPQSILGIQFLPQIGLSFDSLHTISVGANLLKEFGSDMFVDKVHPYVYYKFSGELFSYHFGSFPRRQFLSSNPKLLYYDSLDYFRPYINGLFWTFKKAGFSQSVYLDWTSRQTNTRRETFIMGGQGSYSHGMLFVQNFIYMFHFAGTAIPDPTDNVRDNGVAYLRIGIDASQKTFFDSLSISISGVKSFERSRGTVGWGTPQGLILEAIVEYKGIGVNNTYYKGDGHNLDWGDPFYRLKSYNRLDIYFTPLLFNRVKGRFGISMHFAEGTISHQQQFALLVDLNSKPTKKTTVKVPVWNNW